MQLKNFQLSSDGISLEWQGHDLDIHNCFDFERLTYNLPLRQIEASWLRSPEEWAKGTVLPGLTLVFDEVSFFRVKERDPEYPLTEDNCLLSASFHPVELRDEFDSIFLSNSPADDLTFFFQSEWGFKINAATVELQPLIHLAS
jgi:hypothetical protein